MRFRAAVLAAVMALGPTSIVSPQDDENGAPAAPEGFVLGGDVEAGNALFLEKCSICHGEKGKGNGRIQTDPRPRDLTNREHMRRRSDWEIYLVIREGGKALGLSSKMFPWKRLLSDQETPAGAQAGGAS